MEVTVYLKSKRNEYYAEAKYDGSVFVVLKGGKVRTDFSEHIRGGNLAKTYRDNPEYVDKQGNILQDCSFTSPSTAAQFVNGTSTNGYKAWKVGAKLSLGEFMRQNNMR